MSNIRHKWLVTVDSKGRISIPANLRRKFNLEHGTQFLLVVNPQDNMELRKWE